MTSQPRSYSMVRRRRLCPTCLFKWESFTFYHKGLFTKCPKCGADVPGDSLAKKREASG